MQAYRPTSLKTPEQLGRALSRGLGRAILFLRRCDDIAPYRELLLHHTLHWTGYDQQLEGTRTTYLLDVLHAAGLIDEFAEPVIAALPKTDDGHDHSQLLYLTLAYAQEGNEAARAVLFSMFDSRTPDDPYKGARLLVLLDGLGGLLYVAERIGADFLAHGQPIKADWDDPSSLLRDAGEWHGEEEAKRVLMKAARDNASIAAFAQAAIALEQKDVDRGRGYNTFAGASYEQVKTAINDRAQWPNPKSFGWRRLRRWGEDASEADIVQAAADLLAEEDDSRLVIYLEIFARRMFPGQPDRLLALLRRPRSSMEDHLLVSSAAQALSQVAHPRVRQTALEIIADDSVDGWLKGMTVELFRSNFMDGDEALLTDLLAGNWDDHDRHGIWVSMRNVFEDHFSQAAMPAFQFMYEHGPCSFCRLSIVEHLHQLGQVPRWMKVECRFDANMDIRDLADSWASGDDTAQIEPHS